MGRTLDWKNLGKAFDTLRNLVPVKEVLLENC